MDSRGEILSLRVNNSSNPMVLESRLDGHLVEGGQS
jgi:hypothetical protein